MTTVYIDSFSGSVGGLTTKQRRDARTVLEILARDPNVSTWDMDEHKRFPLWRTIQDLESRGFVVSVERPYPWLRYEITDAGKKFLSAQQTLAADGFESEPKCYCPADGIYPGCPVHGSRRR